MGLFDKIKGAIFGHKDPGPGNRPQIPAGMAGGPPLQQQGQQPQFQQGGATTAQPQQGQTVDVEQALTQIAQQKGNPDLNWRTSIVDLMKLLGIDSSLDNRKELARELGYTGALDGSAEMNIWLHKATMRQLAANGGKVPQNMLD
ncbi:DUF3597 domain-containing protein [Sphingomonas sp. BN140010]|uniref:DUF3597 domain-containing protein n=1 Tax=Sphingomonas arvum TaxID=2992113 RepID=A0ABT3JHK1_9SPHN|nr:DUF3597 domain-containing protein [Sphingomonas sp. BN140010]MCW3798560.1 DUF3597 domain-containing protein [Sphingomonas sp. BN140010]